MGLFCPTHSLCKHEYSTDHQQESQFLNAPTQSFGTFFNYITFDLQNISSSTIGREQEISSLSIDIHYTVRPCY